MPGERWKEREMGREKGRLLEGGVSGRDFNKPDFITKEGEEESEKMILSGDIGDVRGAEWLLK